MEKLHENGVETNTLKRIAKSIAGKMEQKTCSVMKDSVGINLFNNNMQDFRNS